MELPDLCGCIYSWDNILIYVLNIYTYKLYTASGTGLNIALRYIRICIPNSSVGRYILRYDGILIQTHGNLRTYFVQYIYVRSSIQRRYHYYCCCYIFFFHISAQHGSQTFQRFLLHCNYNVFKHAVRRSVLLHVNSNWKSRRRRRQSEFSDALTLVCCACVCI